MLDEFTLDVVAVQVERAALIGVQHECYLVALLGDELALVDGKPSFVYSQSELQRFRVSAATRGQGQRDGERRQRPQGRPDTVVKQDCSPCRVGRREPARIGHGAMPPLTHRVTIVFCPCSSRGEMRAAKIPERPERATNATMVTIPISGLCVLTSMGNRASPSPCGPLTKTVNCQSPCLVHERVDVVEAGSSALCSARSALSRPRRTPGRLRSR